MSFDPRWYQQESIEAAVDFFHDYESRKHEFQILPTGSGKSVVIANVTKELEGETVILQPSKEILLQNYAKYTSYGFRAGIYSSSAGDKFKDRVTFATIGSVIKKIPMFRRCTNFIIDECHQVNPEEGMYHRFLTSLPKAKALGLTATPYRLTSGEGGSTLNFLNRTSPRLFSHLQYYVQTGTLFQEGFLAPLDYYDFNQVDRNRLETNKQGSDFSEASLRSYYREINMAKKTIDYARKILSMRNSLLIFTGTIEESFKVAAGIPGSAVVSGETPAEERDKILKAFKAGRIRCVVNVKVLDTGFDYPGLEAVLIARSTMSLAVYYQIIGRVMRKHKLPDGSMKRGMVVDLGGNLNLFGKIETMEIKQDRKGQYAFWNNGRQLTDIPFTKN